MMLIQIIKTILNYLLEVEFYIPALISNLTLINLIKKEIVFTFLREIYLLNRFSFDKSYQPSRAQECDSTGNKNAYHDLLK